MSEDNKAPEPAESAEPTETTEVVETVETVEPAPKEHVEKKKRWPVTVGIVVIIVIVVGIAGFAWHNTPGFCNAFCHTPMDGYLATYEATPGQSTTDIYGNVVEDAGSMTAAYHRANVKDVTCLTCHEPTLSEQVSEGLHWVAGSYNVAQTYNNTFVPTERTYAQLTEARGVSAEQFCLKSGCHTNSDGSQMTRDDLVELTSYYSRNPHTQPHGDVDCGECHKAHRASTVYCSKCHSDTVIPEGWVSYSEAAAAEPVSIVEETK